MKEERMDVEESPWGKALRNKSFSSLFFLQAQQKENGFLLSSIYVFFFLLRK